MARITNSGVSQTDLASYGKDANSGVSQTDLASYGKDDKFQA